ncbi:hypothetical protein PM082_021319 [Marasmius tenuissimus]|nr:hypothetical protein PM082_021319 [Marasmius tenuissimus]
MSPEALEDLQYLQAARYTLISALALFVWDAILNLSKDYRLIFSGRVNPGWPAIIYVITRIVTFGGLITQAIFLLGALGSHCYIVSKLVLGGFPIFISSETLLLFFRVRAVYLSNRAVNSFFLASFFIVTTSSALVPLTASGANIPGTDYCIIADVNAPLATTLLLIPLINHILVFLAISYRLLGLTTLGDQDRTWRRRRMSAAFSQARKFKFWSVGFGRHLPLLSRTVFRDGQIYILVFIPTTILSAILMSIHRLPKVFHWILIPIHMVIENCMNGYLFRHVREAAGRVDRTNSGPGAHVRFSDEPPFDETMFSRINVFPRSSVVSATSSRDQPSSSLLR